MLTGLTAAVLAGCPSSDDNGGNPPPTSLPDAPVTAPDTSPKTGPVTPDPPPAGFGPAEGVASNDDTFYVKYAIDPHPLPLNEVFSMKLEIFDGADRSQRLTDVEVAVDGRMPMHRHGMNREPQIRQNDDGTFTVTGMLFHMPGPWVLHFDVTRHGITERAQVDIELE